MFVIIHLCNYAVFCILILLFAVFITILPDMYNYYVMIELRVDHYKFLYHKKIIISDNIH